MTELQGKWIKAIEDYYRDSYPASMRKKVLEILPKRQEALSALYETIINTVSAQYRTVPDVIAIQSAISEVIDGYPELSPYSYNNQQSGAKQISDDAGFIPSEQWEEVLRRTGFTEKELRERHIVDSESKGVENV
jgi:hypothetical protein